jgi:simple sugar transport system substrate-binding protein
MPRLHVHNISLAFGLEATASGIVAERFVLGISGLAVTGTLPHNHFVDGRYPFFRRRLCDLALRRRCVLGTILGTAFVDVLLTGLITLNAAHFILGTSSSALPGRKTDPDQSSFKEMDTVFKILKTAATAAVAVAVFATSALSAGIDGAPAPFDKKTVNIAVVSFLGSGDWLQAFEAGVKQQADALGINLTVSQARNDNDVQRSLVEQAINLGVDGIIINNGRPETLKDVTQEALDKGIKVVAYDVNLDNPQIPQIEQSDKDMAKLVLDQAIKDKGDGFTGGAVYVAGFAPLDRRYAVWQDFIVKHNLKEKAVWGVVNDTVPASVADQTKAVLRANPDISVIFTPWDEFAKGAKLAIDELGLSSKVKIYGVDISTADIQLITEPDSAWAATAATNAAVVGEVSVRAVSLAIAGQFPGRSVLLQPTLITRDDLIGNKIGTIEELQQKFPAFLKSDAATAEWIPAAKN